MSVRYWNRSRAARARKALFAHQVDDCQGNKSQARIELRQDPAAILRYLLADLRHWCQKNGIAYHEQDEKARSIYNDEVMEAERAAQDRRKKGGSR